LPAVVGINEDTASEFSSAYKQLLEASRVNVAGQENMTFSSHADTQHR
jgi:hypothetical protein